MINFWGKRRRSRAQIAEAELGLRFRVLDEVVLVLVARAQSELVELAGRRMRQLKLPRPHSAARRA